MRLRELFKDRGLTQSQRRNIRLVLAVLFCFLVIMCNRPAHAIVSVNSGSSGWGPSAASYAGGVLWDVAKKLVSPGSPYSPVEIIKKGSQSAASLAGSVLSRCRAAPQVCVLLAGAAAAAAWYVASHDDGTTYLAKPSSVPPYSGSAGYCYGRYHGSFCVDQSAVSSAAGYVDSYCRANSMCDWTNQTILSGGCSMSGVSTVNCSYTFKQNGSASSSNWSFSLSGSPVSSGTPVNATSQPVTDSDITNTFTGQLAFDPEKALAFVKAQGLWNPDVQLLTEIPVASATPATLVKVEPQADGTVKKTTTTQTPVTTTTCSGSSCTVTTHMETVNNVTVTNSGGTVINNYTDTATTPDGHYSTDATQAPPLEIPTDYGREATQQQIRDQLKFSRPGTVLEAPTFSGTLSTFWTGLGSLPLLAPFKTFFSALFSISGSCPEYSIPFFGHSLPMTAHCTLGQLAAGIFYLITALMYSVPAVRVFLSA